MGSLSTRAGVLRKENFSWSKPESGIFYIDWVPLGAGSPQQTNHTEMQYDYSREHYVGMDLPDFHKRKSAGELLPYTSYQKASVTFTGSGHLGWSDSNYDYNWTGPGPFFQFYAQTWEALGVTTIAQTLDAMGLDPRYQVQRAAAKLYSRGWDALTFVAELHKTVSMFKNALKSFGNLLESTYDMANTGTVLPHMYAPLSTWMEFRYGWRILMYDIEDIKNLIASLGTARRKFYKERVGDSYTDTESSIEFNDFGIFTAQVDFIRDVELSIRGSIVTDFVPDSYITNIPITAWELTKLSFVLDWFYNVGQALQALSFATFSPNYTAAWGAELNITRSTGNAQSNITNPAVTDLRFDQETDLRFEGLMRVPCTVPLAPQVNVHLDAFKLVDLLALVYQAFGRLANR